MADETLRAIITGKETASAPLRDVADAARDVAEGAVAAAGGLSDFGAAAGRAESQAEDLAGALSDVTEAAAGTGGALEATEHQIDDVGDEATESATEVAGLAGALHTLPEHVDVDIDIDRDGIQSTLTSLTAERGIDIAVPDQLTTTVDAPGDIELDGATARIDTLADLSGVVEAKAALASIPDRTTAHISTAFDRDSIQSTLRSFVGDEDRTVRETIDRQVDAVGEVSLDGLAAARAELFTFEQALTRLDGKTATVSVGVDSDRASAPDVADLDDITRSVQTAIDVDTDGLQQARLMADGLGEHFDEIAVSARVAEDALDAIRGAAPGIGATAAATEALDDAATESAASSHLLAEGLEDISADAVGAAGAVSLASSRVDDLGDEASESAFEITGLSGAMASLRGATGLTTHLGPFAGSLSTIAKLAAPAAAGIASIGAATAGAGIGSIGVLGVGGLATAAGALGIGERIAAEDPTDDIETATDGLGEFFADIKSQAADILEPLQNAANERLFTNLIGTGLGVLEDAVTLTQRLRDDLSGFTDALGSAWDAVSPQTFAALEDAAKTVLPALEDFTVGSLEALPRFINFAVEEFEQLAPLAGDVFDQFTALLGPLAEFGTGALSVLLPVLEAIGYVLRGLVPLIDAFVPLLEGAGEAASDFVDAVGPGLSVLTTLAASLFAVVKVAGLASGALSVLSGISSALSAVLGTGLLPSLSTVTGALASLVNPVTLVAGAIVGLISVMGWWDEVFDTLGTTFNYVIEYFELLLNLSSIARNVLLGVADAVISWISPFESVGEVMQVTGRWIDHVIGKIVELARIAGQYLAPVAEAIGLVDDKIGEAGGVSLDEYKVETGGTAQAGAAGQPSMATVGSGTGTGSEQVSQGVDSLRGGRDDGQRGGQSSAPTSGDSYAGDTVINVDARGTGGDEGRIEAAVERAMERYLTQERRRSSTTN